LAWRQTIHFNQQNRRHEPRINLLILVGRQKSDMPRTEIGPQLKSRRLAYFDATKGRTKTKVFTALEISQANSVFEKVEDILIENDIDILCKYVSISKCHCLKHDDTCFIVDVGSEDISMDVLRDIEDNLEELQVKFVGVAASHHGRRDYLELVIIQKHIHNEIEIDSNRMDS
jgi:hypothetical protein